MKKAGDTIRRPQLAATLRTIADKGADVFYRGSLASDIVADLRDGYVLKPGGESIMTETDLDNYRYWPTEIRKICQPNHFAVSQVVFIRLL